MDKTCKLLATDRSCLCWDGVTGMCFKVSPPKEISFLLGIWKYRANQKISIPLEIVWTVIDVTSFIKKTYRKPIDN
jgi:hypothetical protein